MIQLLTKSSTPTNRTEQKKNWVIKWLGWGLCCALPFFARAFALLTLGSISCSRVKNDISFLVSSIEESEWDREIKRNLRRSQFNWNLNLKSATHREKKWTGNQNKQSECALWSCELQAKPHKYVWPFDKLQSKYVSCAVFSPSSLISLDSFWGNF